MILLINDDTLHCGISLATARLLSRRTASIGLDDSAMRWVTSTSIKLNTQTQTAIVIYIRQCQSQTDYS